MKNQPILILVIFLIGLSPTSNAEVLDAANNGFVIESKATVESSPEQSYQQFMRINEWWDGDHSWFGSADNFSISNKVGGCFCEIDGDRQVEHMRVSFVDPNKEVRLLGGLGPLQMMGVHGAMSWKFVALESGGTEIVHRYAVSGFLNGGLDKLAPVVDAVQTSQLKRLQSRLSKK